LTVEVTDGPSINKVGNAVVRKAVKGAGILDYSTSTAIQPNLLLPCPFPLATVFPFSAISFICPFPVSLITRPPIAWARGLGQCQTPKTKFRRFEGI
jgi:hypothetical protein